MDRRRDHAIGHVPACAVQVGGAWRGGAAAPHGGLATRYPVFRAALLEGYAAQRPLPPDTEVWLDTLILLRRYGTLQWMIDDWPRPDHRAWGPAFLRDLGVSLRALVREAG